MRFVRGRIILAQEKSLTNAVAEVEVIDCSLMGAPAVTLGSATIHPSKFPFEYEIEYDDSVLSGGIYGQYAIQVTISVNGKLAYLNDTRHSLIDYRTNQILEKIDVKVIAI